MSIVDFQSDLRTDACLFEFQGRSYSLSHLHATLENLKDLIAVAMILEDENGGLVLYRDKEHISYAPPQVALAGRLHVDYIHMDSPLTVIISVTAGASALIALFNRMLKARVNYYEGQTTVAAEKLKTEAYDIIRHELIRKSGKNPETMPGGQNPIPSGTMNDAADVLMRLENVQRIER